MEALLSLSFDNITSKDSAKIRKGLRQIEGLLAQICLSRQPDPAAAAKQKRNGSASKKTPSEHKHLGALHTDPAFREFFRLQEGFEWNGESPHPAAEGLLLTKFSVATRLILCLERLLGMGASKYPTSTLPRKRSLTQSTRRPKRHPHSLRTGPAPGHSTSPPAFARII